MTDNAQSPLIEPSIVAPITVATAQKTKKQTPDRGGFIWGVGRRKSSVARVRIKPGSGTLLVNDKKIDEYFCLKQDVETAVAALKCCEVENNFDIFINVNGGGTTGQAGAVLLGIARALANYDEEFLKPLRDTSMLTRDGRMKERKKPGQRGARRKFQFSKR
jgi:small subunit ribosomal protein S9